MDVLNAQRDLVIARTTLVKCGKEPRGCAPYQLLAAIGHLTAKDLGLGVAIYDPERNYDRVRDKWFGGDVETVE